LIVAAACFALVAPTLDWLQFHDPIENLNVRDGPGDPPGRAVARSDAAGVPRLAKPPLTAWVTAAAIRPATVAALDS